MEQAVLMLHDFFGILKIYDSILSRAQRISLFFLKLNLLIAISGLFSQQMNLV
jgi:hypothetical protein